MSVTNLKEIEAFIHCGLCLKELPKNKSPQDFIRVEFGWTQKGLQVWCLRHECNILHIDFQGMSHPANTTRQRTKKELV